MCKVLLIKKESWHNPHNQPGQRKAGVRSRERRHLGRKTFRGRNMHMVYRKNTTEPVKANADTSLTTNHSPDHVLLLRLPWVCGFSIDLVLHERSVVACWRGLRGLGRVGFGGSAVLETFFCFTDCDRPLYGQRCFAGDCSLRWYQRGLSVRDQSGCRSAYVCTGTTSTSLTRACTWDGGYEFCLTTVPRTSTHDARVITRWPYMLP